MQKIVKPLILLILTLSIFISLTSYADNQPNQSSENSNLSNNCTPPYCDIIKSAHGLIEVNPVEHASFALTYQNNLDDLDQRLMIVVDPVDNINKLTNYRPVDIILVTDIHRDHFDPEALQALMEADTTLIVPQSVANENDFPEFFAGTIIILNNGEQYDLTNIHIEAMPMYNLDPERNYHPRGRGNGYVLTIDDQRIYISGDSQATPEMLALTNIDAAFVAMNLPFTMGVDEASEAVLAFKPHLVYPYHYRNGDGTFSDLQRFRDQVAKDPDITVRLLDWYPNR